MCTAQNRQLGRHSDRLISLLLRCADHELLTHGLYRALFNGGGMSRVPELQGLSRTASDEDWEHYQGVLGCVRRLTTGEVSDRRRCGADDLLKLTSSSTLNLLDQLRTAEHRLVRSYHEICLLTIERDYRTFDISFRNMTENAQHQERVSKLLTTDLGAESRGAHLACPADPR